MSDLLPETLKQWVEISTQRSMYEIRFVLRALGISMPQFMLLRLLQHIGPCVVSDIARHLEITKPAASQLIQRLVEQGLLENKRSPVDRRSREIFLTDNGREFLNSATDAQFVWIEALADQLPETGKSDLEAAIMILIQAANKSDLTHKLKEKSS